jgi:hypothetical protein
LGVERKGVAAASPQSLVDHQAAGDDRRTIHQIADRLIHGQIGRIVFMRGQFELDVVQARIEALVRKSTISGTEFGLTALPEDCVAGEILLTRQRTARPPIRARTRSPIKKTAIVHNSVRFTFSRDFAQFGHSHMGTAWSGQNDDEKLRPGPLRLSNSASNGAMSVPQLLQRIPPSYRAAHEKARRHGGNIIFPGLASR